MKAVTALKWTRLLFGLESILQSSVFVGGIIIVTLSIMLVVLLRSAERPDRPRRGKSADITPTSGETLGFMEHINRGNECLSRYEYDHALSHFQEAAKIRPNEVSVHFKIGRIYAQKEDPKNAVVAFRNVLNLNPGQIDAHFELARVFQSQKNFEQAHNELNQALNINPDHEETLKLKAKLFEQEEKYAQALPVIRRLASVSRQPIKYRSKAAEYLTLMKKHEESISEYETLIAIDPIHRAIYTGKIGQSYFEMGYYSRAIELFKQVLQDQAPQTPESDAVTAVKVQMAAALCNEGVKLFDGEDFASAVQRYQEALMYDDNNPDIHYNLGKAYVRVRDVIHAIKHFERAIALNPDDTASIFELAVLQDEKGMLPEALANYRLVLELDPAHVQANFGLGTLYGLQNNIDESLRYLSEAVRLNPQFVDALYNLGVALERKKDFNKAVQIYKNVLQLEPAHERAMSNLAHIAHMKSQSL